MNYIRINKKILPEKQATISVLDRGWRFGDGIFTTCLIVDQIIYNWSEHLRRLEQGLESLKIKFDCSDLQQLSKLLVKKNKINHGYLRISISRGLGSIGYLPIKNIQPTLVIETVPINTPASGLIKLTVSNLTKPSLKSLPVNYKLMQGVNSTLAKIYAQENNYFDAILLNDQGQICETSSANIFWIKNNILYTPHPDCGLLLGTTRQKILQLSPIKIKLIKAKLVDLLEADEVFITNVAIGVLRVDQIGVKKFKNKKYSTIFSNLLHQDIKEYVNKTNS